MDHINVGMLGLGSRSTTYYLAQLNKLYQQQNGGFSTFPLILLNTNFDRINSLLPHVSASLDSVVQNYINEIEKLGIKHILVPNITLHQTIDRLIVTTKIIHPIHLTVAIIKRNNWNEVFLFASLHSMQSSYMSSIFNANGIKVLLPVQEDMLFLDKFRIQVYNETETEELINKYHAIIEKYSSIITVVLACTELSILKPKMHQSNLIDMAEVQIQAMVSSAS